MPHRHRPRHAGTRQAEVPGRSARARRQHVFEGARSRRIGNAKHTGYPAVTSAWRM